MTGGLALEGLNNAGDSDADLLIVLNDNEMAIDGNKGGLHSYLLRLTTDPTYNKIKNSVWNRLGEARPEISFRDSLEKRKKAWLPNPEEISSRLSGSGISVRSMATT